ncbi:probable imidazolonepropionase isoform X4 [Phyllopteryx taeniolatus]|uniref:probable imidazolonepropionase isoform X4 n=1 Tax=Phyllopteryx taeniolatus TaxID=161469 RepID=UPI002AD2C214|nr:probable imidazolonepropionase isoform X4 [Phyllopteryx taeniolatus]
MSYGPAGFATFFGSFAPASDGLIEAAGPADVMERRYSQASFDRVIDAAGMCVLPGLVDAHTHPIWAGDRVHEFAMKLAGATYMDVHRAGGGIHFTVERTRAASARELLASLSGRLERARRAGTTLVEVKSGYGLELAAELKMLEVVEEARRTLPINISSTYCGAHAVPKGKSVEEATRDILQVQLPALKERMAAGTLRVDNIDVFCEEGVFDVPSTRAILLAGKDMGLNANFHGDELSPTNAAEVGVRSARFRRAAFIARLLRVPSAAGGRAGGAGRQPPGGSVGPGHRRHGAGRDGGRPAAYHGLRSPAPPTAGASHAGRGRHRGAGQRLQPQRVLLLHAHRHAPGVRQHEDVHARGLGGGHHQRRLRPRTLAHARLTGGGQTRRPAAHRRPAVGAPHLSAGRTSGAHPLRRRQGRRRLRQPPHAALVKSSCKRRPEFLADSSHLDGLDSS